MSDWKPVRFCRHEKEIPMDGENYKHCNDCLAEELEEAKTPTPLQLCSHGEPLNYYCANCASEGRKRVGTKHLIEEVARALNEGDVGDITDKIDFEAVAKQWKENDLFPLRHLYTHKERKERPLATGVLDYFPDALLEVAHCSFVGNEQHNPGQPVHWDKSKSADEADALLRHLLERGTTDSDGVRHTAKVAWRALALLQREIDAERQDKS